MFTVTEDDAIHKQSNKVGFLSIPYSAEPNILTDFKNSNTCVTAQILSTWNGFGKIIILNFIKLYFSLVVR